MVYPRTMAELETGNIAPAFTLTDAFGKVVSLADYAGSKVILYFYPAALTPGCTVEAVDFTAAAPAFHEAGYRIIGISPDEQPRLEEFITQNNITITLLGDPDKDTIMAYGTWGERTLWGKVVTGLIRSTFVIDVDPSGTGVILDAQYAVRATGHVKRLRDSLGI